MALCRAAISASVDRGDRFGLLFTDIAPQYYGRLGFRLCTQDRFVCTALKSLRDSGPRCLLEPFEGQETVAFLARCYQSRHEACDLAIWRDRAEWLFLLKSNPGLDLLWLRDQGGAVLGYAWIHQSAEQIVPVEIVPLRPDLAVEAQAVRALAGLALSSSTPKLSGWQPPPPELSDFFSVQPRGKALPMIWAAPGSTISDRVLSNVPIYSSVYF